MTTEQRLFKLEKRIALLEQQMNIQEGVLYAKYATDPVNKLRSLLSVRLACVQSQIIASQPMPKFERGGVC